MENITFFKLIIFLTILNFLLNGIISWKPLKFRFTGLLGFYISLGITNLYFAQRYYKNSLLHTFIAILLSPIYTLYILNY
jgi:hypothetical protein